MSVFLGKRNLFVYLLTAFYKTGTVTEVMMIVAAMAETEPTIVGLEIVLVEIVIEVVATAEIDTMIAEIDTMIVGIDMAATGIAGVDMAETDTTTVDMEIAIVMMTDEVVIAMETEIEDVTTMSKIGTRGGKVTVFGMEGAIMTERNENQVRGAQFNKAGNDFSL